MEGESVGSTGSDPLQAVADAMDAAVNAAKEGVEGARASATEVLPAINGFLSRAVYKTCYSISYGVVFPSLLIARSIPKNNAVIHGFVDGAHAARDMVDEMKPKSAVVSS
jgi:hypothetical protein